MLTVILAFVLLVTLYGVSTVFWAWTQTKQAPREDMVECHTGKHGPYPKKYAIEQDLGLDKPVYLCPHCYSAAFQTARDIAKKPEKEMT